jgi:hypothetical protein
VCKSTGCGHKKKVKQKLVVGVNDLATLRPDIASECVIGDPKSVTIGSGKLFFWKCPVGHPDYEASVVSRTREKGSKCGVCTGNRVVPGINDLATTHPSISAEATNGCDPTKVSAGSHDVFWWTCPLGHAPYEAVIKGRTMCRMSRGKKINSNGCPTCKGRRIEVGINDLATTHPSLAALAHNWDPKKYTAGSSEVVEWKCLCGLITKSSIGSKTKCPAGNCRKCAKAGFDPSKPSFIYLVCRPGQFKCGIANHGSGRLIRHKRNGWSVIETIDASGQIVEGLERAVKKNLRIRGVPTGRKAFREWFDGYTEAWNAADLEVSSIRDLCEKIGVPLAV